MLLIGGHYFAGLAFFTAAVGAITGALAWAAQTRAAH